ncbi:hypothetical protein GW860_00270 [bacterium]|nr:hypothetical protein [bacterium]
MSSSFYQAIINPRIKKSETLIIAVTKLRMSLSAKTIAVQEAFRRAER